MILLIDADSLIFASCYRSKDDISDYPYYEDIEDEKIKMADSL